MKLYQYAVTGHGDFPVDMLRYDAAYPATTSAVTGITDRAPGARWAETRSVMLRSWKKPTKDRWNSFGWAISEVQEQKV